MIIMCPAYLATAADSMEQKEKVAKDWSQQFGATIVAKDINCMGCKSEGPYFQGHAGCPGRP